MFKRIFPHFTNAVAILYYNAFIRSSFSYAPMYRFNIDSLSRFTLMAKFDSLIALLVKHSGLICNDSL